MEIDHARKAVGLLDLMHQVSMKNSTQMVTWHTQRWRKSGNAFTLAPLQKKNMLVKQKSGITRVSCASETWTANASASVGGSYADVSASVSASVGYSGTSTDPVTLQNSATTTVEDMIENPDPKKALIIVHWERVDTFVAVHGKLDTTTSSISMANVSASSTCRAQPWCRPIARDTASGSGTLKEGRQGLGPGGQHVADQGEQAEIAQDVDGR